MVLLPVLAVAVGAFVVLATLLSAIRTVVLPRGESVLVTRALFATTRVVFEGLRKLRGTYSWSDRVMSLYAPVSLLLLPLIWLSGLLIGFTLIFWVVEGSTLAHAFDTSGSSLLTLGFTKPDTGVGVALAFTAASLALAIVALLLVTYLPSMYQAFSSRERLVSLLEARAGSPPTGIDFVTRMHRINGFAYLDSFWTEWERWFAEAQETHTSLPALVFFRSPRPDRSWITAAGALLDAASLTVSCLDLERAVPRDAARMPLAEICIRAGYLCLREIADFFGLPHDADPRPDDPIALTRAEFDAAFARLAGAGVAVVADQEAAWRAFAGWRVNYETVMLALADLTVAPVVPWVSDRSPVGLESDSVRHHRAV